MTREENIALIERFHRTMLDSRELDAIDEFVAEDFASHSTPPGLPAGLAGVRSFFETFHSAFPDADLEIEQLVADGEWVAVASRLTGTHTGSLMGLDATGREASVAMIDLVRIADGKIVEHRGLTDTVGLMRQLTE